MWNEVDTFSDFAYTSNYSQLKKRSRKQEYVISVYKNWYQVSWVHVGNPLQRSINISFLIFIH